MIDNFHAFYIRRKLIFLKNSIAVALFVLCF